MKKTVAYILAALLSILFVVGMALIYRNMRQEQDLVTCSQLEVSFADTLRFVSEEDIREYLDTRYGTYIGQRLDSVQLSRIEDLLAERSAVQSGQAWTTSDGVLHVLVTQRAPVLRFQDGRRSFYVDADGNIFPPHDTYIASVPTVEGTIPFDIPEGFRGEAPSDEARKWILGMIGMYNYISSSRNWQHHINTVRVRGDGDLLLTIDGRSEQFIIGQPDNIKDKFLRIDRYIGTIAPSVEEGHYRTVNVKYNNQIICRQKDT